VQLGVHYEKHAALSITMLIIIRTAKKYSSLPEHGIAGGSARGRSYIPHDTAGKNFTDDI